jgi:hypothetical protein
VNIPISPATNKSRGWLLLIIGLMSLAWNCGLVGLIQTGHIVSKDVYWYYMPLSIFVLTLGIRALRKQT